MLSEEEKRAVAALKEELGDELETLVGAMRRWDRRIDGVRIEIQGTIEMFRKMLTGVLKQRGRDKTEHEDMCNALRETIDELQMVLDGLAWNQKDLEYIEGGAFMFPHRLWLNALYAQSYKEAERAVAEPGVDDG